MKNVALEQRLSAEIANFIAEARCLNLATVTPEGLPFCSSAPFAIDNDCFYVLLSELAVHGRNLQSNPMASVLIIEPEQQAAELYARVRLNYTIKAELISPQNPEFNDIVECLVQRLGERPRMLSELGDFKLFRLIPEGGRYVKGFGKAYEIQGKSLTGESLDHLTA